MTRCCHVLPAPLQPAAQVEVDGSTINMIDVTRFPVSTDMSGALVKIAAGEWLGSWLL